MYVDLRALRNDRVTLVERGAPHSLCLTESGKLLPGVKVRFLFFFFLLHLSDVGSPLIGIASLIHLFFDQFRHI